MAEPGIPKLAEIAELGVGLNYQAQFLPFLEKHSAEFDFLEIVPDIFWVDHGRGASPRYVEDSVQMDFLRRIRERMPVVLHSIGLSIGSAHQFNRDHLAQISLWQRRLGSPWHSDHLAYHLTEGALAAAHGFASLAESNAGVTMPLSRSRANLRMLAERVGEVRRAVDAPFLIENNVYFVDMPSDEMDEGQFLNDLCREAGCGLVLDLHNVYCNSLNMGFDAYGLLDRLEMANVVEIHLGGGNQDGPYYLDSHSGATPEPVWDLLEHVLILAPNLKGIVFELFGSWYESMGEKQLVLELSRMRDAWNRYRAIRSYGKELCA